jgi:hypothetical protein
VRFCIVCWEHQEIPDLASAIPTAEATTIPAVWPGDRFDVVWTFTLDPATGRYRFGQVPQQLLPGDTDVVISPAPVANTQRRPPCRA